MIRGEKSAQQNGYDTSLYEQANKNLVIGDYGVKARKLFDDEKISESHYYQLLIKIGVNV